AVFAATAMLAPSLAARSAIARPIPRLAPVMKRVLPLSDMGRVSVVDDRRPVIRAFDGPVSLDPLVPIHAVGVAGAADVAAGDEAVEVGQAFAGRHAVIAAGDLGAEKRREHV